MGVGSERDSLHGKPFVILFWWSLYWSHTCWAELDRRRVSACVLSLPWSWYPHEATEPTKERFLLLLNDFHSGSKTERSALAERTSRRHCPIYAPHTNNKKQKVHAGRSKLLVRNYKVMRSILGILTRIFVYLFQCLHANLWEHTHLQTLCFFPPYLPQVITLQSSSN